MVSFTTLAATISTALLATTTLGNQVVSFTLYKTLQAGSENQCWWGAPGNNFGTVDSSELSGTPSSPCGTTSNCHQGDFYTLRIYWEAQGYNCAGIQFLIPTAK